MCGVYSQQKHRVGLWYKELHLLWTLCFFSQLLFAVLTIREEKNLTLLWGCTWMIQKQNPTEGVDSFVFGLSCIPLSLNQAKLTILLLCDWCPSPGNLKVTSWENVVCKSTFEWVGKSLQTSFYRSNPQAIINKKLECSREKNTHPNCSVIYTQLCTFEANPWKWCHAGIVLLLK